MKFKMLKPFEELRRGESASTATAKWSVRSLCCDLNLIKRCFQGDKKKASEVNAAFRGQGARSWQQQQIKALSQTSASPPPSSCQVSLVHPAQAGGLCKRSLQQTGGCCSPTQHCRHTTGAAALTGKLNTQPRAGERC